MLLLCLKNWKGMEMLPSGPFATMGLGRFRSRFPNTLFWYRKWIRGISDSRTRGSVGASEVLISFRDVLPRWISCLSVRTVDSSRSYAEVCPNCVRGLVRFQPHHPATQPAHHTPQQGTAHTPHNPAAPHGPGERIVWLCRIWRSRSRSDAGHLQPSRNRQEMHPRLLTRHAQHAIKEANDGGSRRQGLHGQVGTRCPPPWGTGGATSRWSWGDPEETRGTSRLSGLVRRRTGA